MHRYNSRQEEALFLAIGFRKTDFISFCALPVPRVPALTRQSSAISSRAAIYILARIFRPEFPFQAAYLHF
jgi:hypothetical protein